MWRKNSGKIYTDNTILPLEKWFLVTGLENDLEEEIGLLQTLLSHVKPVFLQVTREVKYVILRNSNPTGTFLRIIKLQVKQQPTSEGAKKRESKSTLGSFLKMAVLWISESLMPGNGNIWHFKKLICIQWFLFLLTIKTSELFLTVNYGCSLKERNNNSNVLQKLWQG